jgi:UDP-2,3-diacylglucosamine pyrophosphatase LpxH
MHRPSLQGIALSDLHLFAHRSAGRECFDSLKPRLAAADVVVLNGDIFDFRWSTLPDASATTLGAREWLQQLCAAFPQCNFHYVIGNHDCPAFFRAELAKLAASVPRFHWHENGVRIGRAVFVHGDCTHRRMDPPALRRFRADWDNDRRHGLLRAKAYVAVDRAGITRLAHQCWFPRNVTVARVAHYLDHALPHWREHATDCYFGHTHLPFTDHRHEGIRYHNTGSGIRGMGFNPRSFNPSTVSFESLASLLD